MSRESAGASTAAAPALVLASAIVVAWALVLSGGDAGHAGPAAFLAAWTVMMMAMMLPSTAPLILLYRKGASPLATIALVAGYIVVWAATGVPAYLAEMHLPSALAPAALAAAGIYQLTALKSACLLRCRSPVNFLVQRWGRGPIRLGAEHGAWCVGCCWALMLVLVLVGSMGLPWVVGIAALVAAEKLSPHGVAIARASGVALIVAAIYSGVTTWPGN